MKYVINNQFLFTIAALIIALVIGFFLTVPKYNDFSIAIKNQKNIEINLQAKKDRIVTVDEALEKFKNYQDELKKIDQALPDTEFLPSLDQFFKSIGASHNIVLAGTSGMSYVDRKKSSSEIKDLGPISQRSPREITVNLSPSGKYNDFKSFLLALENSARLVDVERLSFSISSVDKGDISATMTVNVHSY